MVGKRSEDGKKNSHLQTEFAEPSGKNVSRANGSMTRDLSAIA